MSKSIRTLAALAAMALAAAAHAQPATGKAGLPEYRTAGRLNASGDNAILVAPGLWDSMIGPGRPFDTERYFILTVETPAGAPDAFRVQKALAESLGIRKFAAIVVGPDALEPRSPYDRDFDFD